MQTNTIIEDLIARELRAICGTCIHRDACVYRKTSTRAIIQCELFQLDQEQVPDDPHTKRGLCITCDLADTCTLAGRRQGVWHCREFC